MVNYFLIPTSFLFSTPTYITMPLVQVFFIGQRTFSRNVCDVQASSNGNNGLQQHCDMSQQWQLFFLHDSFYFSYNIVFFLLQVFSSSDTLFFLVVHFFFPITHDPISIVMNVNYFLVAHDFFLSFSPSSFNYHVIDSVLSAQNFFPNH